MISIASICIVIYSFFQADAVQGLYDVYQRHAGQFEFYLPQLASVLANNASVAESQALEVFLLDKSERCVAYQLGLFACVRAHSGWQTMSPQCRRRPPH